ncbi:SRPBCC family protein [Streptomyces himalayensis]|uniref:SRPBCC family protein n=1 Tax=Streptomyces himalayensis subsp. himalayensis TaxID=2756131 RepID=A0A7W0DLQ1_9ACTN|nr:SRPBCC family protein [Streptomyces himalayensis]MBA2947414.1 SRPBCC family protein [Streptomyces himalayensis subsp. himalayensis]
MAEQLDERRTVGGVGTLAKELPTERLIQETQNLLAALGSRALSKVTEAAGGRVSLGKAVLKPILKAGLHQATEKVKHAIPGGKPDGGEKSKLKAVNIVEEVDVGVPVSVAYNQWTQFEEFPSFMKKVEVVEQTSDTELDWKAKIFLSTREWHSEILEQVPDKRIVWRSDAVKGYVDGAVTFHELAPDLTKVLLVLQYHPKGLFELSGNLWRAQGRRARLELKHYRRHLMTEALLHPEKVEGWRGEVHGGKVVRRGEEQPEEEAELEEKGPEEEELEEEEPEEEAEEEEAEEEEAEEEEPEDEYEEEPEDEDEEVYERERRTEPEDEYEDEFEDEDEDEEDYVEKERR